MRFLPKILTSLLVTGVVASSALLISNAYFSDTENSTGNTFQAGELDLKIDNTSYYNGKLNEGTSWTLDNLGGNPGHLFFDFNDLKPGDWGEDTISLHVANSAWACMDINITQNNDNGCNEPESIDDQNCLPDSQDLTDGELGDQLNFIFWADDGDNVFEDDETVWKQGKAIDLFTGTVWPLADTSVSIWSPSPSPIPADTTVYIGKAWCHGAIGLAPIPEGDNSPVGPVTNSGITCNGEALNNTTQTDLLKADVSFTAIQSRHNSGYLCNAPVTPSPTPPPGIATTLVINEVLPDSSCFQGQTEAQWLEIYNGYNYAVNLKNFKITDGTNTIDLVTANSVIVQPGTLVILAHSTSIFGNNKCFPDPGVTIANLGGQLNIDTGLLKLLDQNNIIIDRVEWGSSPLTPAQNQSVERQPLGFDTAALDTFNSGDFTVRNPPTPGL